MCLHCHYCPSLKQKPLLLTQNKQEVSGYTHSRRGFIVSVGRIVCHLNSEVPTRRVNYKYQRIM